MIYAMLKSGCAYESRFGFTDLTVRVIGGSLTLAAATLALPLPAEPQLAVAAGLTAVGISVGGLYGYLVGTKRLGLRVDEHGLTISKSPLCALDSVPWAHIEQVYLFQVPTVFATVTYVGLDLRDGAPRLGPIMTEASAGSLGPVPAQVALTSRPAVGWRIDVDLLVEAIRTCAPEVGIVDLTRHNQRAG